MNPFLLNDLPPTTDVFSRRFLGLLVFGVSVAFSACRPPEPLSDEPRVLGPPERRGISRLSVQPSTLLTVTVDPRRSLAVTELAIASRFSFQEVMERFATQSGIPGLTALQLYREWWDSQRAAPGLGLGGPHCDDLSADGQAVLNDFLYTCPRAEGAQADENPFDLPERNPASYVPLGVFNRFDLAAVDGSDCGEYRLLFARRSGMDDSRARNFIMFEAVLENPHPELGLEGCRPLVQFWADLSLEPDVFRRADALHRLYFEGLPGGFGPVMDFDNFGNRKGRPTGQVRTNQFMQSTWTLREFRLRRRCAGSTCNARFEPDTVKTNPTGLLFSPTATHALKAEFQATAFPAQVASLAVGDLFGFGMHLEDRFNGGQSNSIGTDNSYVFQLGSSANAFKATLQQQLTAMGSALTPTQVVARAQALSCSGCHQLSTRSDLGDKLTWPFKSNTFGFVHVSERTQEVGPDGPRYAISEAMTTTLLPHREQLMEGFLIHRLPL